jgi:hypothetical protein
MFIEIHKADYIDRYRIKAWFSNGDIAIIDLEDQLAAPVFKPLQDISKFKDFQVKYGTIQWASGADFAPEFLYDIGEKIAVYEIQDPATDYFRKDGEKD